MKTLFTTMALASGLIVAAGTAHAASAYECQQFAQAQMEAAYPTGGGAAAGAIGGGILGGLIAGATGGNVGTGVGVGAVGGLVVGSASWQAKRKQVFDSAYWSCMNSGPPAPPPAQPVYAPVPPYMGTVYQGLNVRSGGSTAYPVLFVLQPGEVFQVVDCGASIGFPGWCYIQRSNGQAGYASRSYLKPT